MTESVNWDKISLSLTVLLIGIPTAANFYPPLFAGVAEQLPISTILGVMEVFGYVALGLFIGRISVHYTNPQPTSTTSNSPTTSPDSIEAIEGCLQVGEVLWRSTAQLTQENTIDYIDTPYKAYCPQCQSLVYDDENSSPIRGGFSWNCPRCEFETLEDGEAYDDAQKLFDTFFHQITDSDGEDYSLRTLIERIDGEVTPQAIWEEYAEVVDDEQVSTSCFH